MVSLPEDATSRDAGIPGFLENAAEMFGTSTPAEDDAVSYIALWLERFGEEWVRTPDLYAMALHPEIILDLGASSTERAQKRVLGATLSRWHQAIFEIDGQSVRVERERDLRRKVFTYRLRKLPA